MGFSARMPGLDLFDLGLPPHLEQIGGPLEPEALTLTIPVLVGPMGEPLAKEKVR